MTLGGLVNYSSYCYSNRIEACNEGHKDKGRKYSLLSTCWTLSCQVTDKDVLSYNIYSPIIQAHAVNQLGLQSCFKELQIYWDFLALCPFSPDMKQVFVLLSGKGSHVQVLRTFLYCFLRFCTLFYACTS